MDLTAEKRIETTYPYQSLDEATPIRPSPAWPGAKTAMQYQHPELEIVRAALDHDATGENKG